MGEAAEAVKSKPNLCGFIPFGYQCEVLRLINNHNYALFTPEILLSGSVGSAKSILLAHIAIVHCIQFPGAYCAIGRRSLGDLKKTLFREILEHLEESMVEGEHYKVLTQNAEIRFNNGSVIQAVTWGDGRFAKFRSLKLSMIIIEEFTENDDEFEAGFKILKARLRRIPTVSQNLLICATNPDEPDTFCYKYFIEGAEKFPSRFVFYSVTTDNFYLDPVYIEQLLQDYSVLEAERYLRGRWISISGLGIYHAYSEERNLKKEPFKPDPRLPLRIAFDFNTAEGKPQSCTVFQSHKDGTMHFFQESVIDGAKWCIDNLDDLDARGVFDWQDREGNTYKWSKFIVHGDASGRARSSNSLRSNYDLIEEWFAQRGLNLRLEVPKSNPALVKRWTTVNALCQNAKLEVKLFVYPGCPVLNQGMKLAKKKPGTAIEDDSKRYQHITTALGYGVCFVKDSANIQSKVIQL